jgi:hypothetical protein
MLVVFRMVARMLHNDAMLAPDRHIGAGIRAIYDDAMLAADACRSLFPWPSI